MNNSCCILVCSVSLTDYDFMGWFVWHILITLIVTKLLCYFKWLKINCFLWSGSYFRLIYPNSLDMLHQRFGKQKTMSNTKDVTSARLLIYFLGLYIDLKMILSIMSFGTLYRRNKKGERDVYIEWIFWENGISESEQTGRALWECTTYCLCIFLLLNIVG